MWVPRFFDPLPTVREINATPLRPLYLRLLERGKAKKLALTALMRKLVILANHLLKNPDFTLAV
jgi:hypothetical protein